VSYRASSRSFTGLFLEVAGYLKEHSLEENPEVLIRFPLELETLRSKFRTLHVWHARVEHAREKLVTEASRLGLARSDLRYMLELSDRLGPLPDPTERGAW
jgi:hypothetical protein